MTLKKKISGQSVPVCFSLALTITGAKSLPHGLNENFTISPTVHDEATLFGFRPTGGRGKKSQIIGGGVRVRWRIGKSSHLNIIKTSFSLPRISISKSVKCKTNVVGEPAQRLKTFLFFHNPPPEKSWLRRGIKE